MRRLNVASAEAMISAAVEGLLANEGVLASEGITVGVSLLPPLLLAPLPLLTPLMEDFSLEAWRGEGELETLET